MNNNEGLLKVAMYPLHDPALEVIRRMNEKHIRVRMSVPKKASEKFRAHSVEFEVLDGPVTVINPTEVLEKAIAETVKYFNANRGHKQAVKAKGTKIVFLETKDEAKAEPAKR